MCQIDQQEGAESFSAIGAHCASCSRKTIVGPSDPPSGARVKIMNFTDFFQLWEEFRRICGEDRRDAAKVAMEEILQKLRVKFFLHSGK